MNYLKKYSAYEKKVLAARKEKKYLAKAYEKSRKPLRKAKKSAELEELKGLRLKNFTKKKYIKAIGNPYNVRLN